jgi:hypothetical protein
MIAVLTPTIRPDGLAIVDTALQRQLGVEYKWLIGSPFKPEVDCVWVEDNYKDGVWSLNRIYNDLIKKAKELDCKQIISIQDYTFFNPDTLSRFVYYLNNGYDVVGGIGDKYASVYPLAVEVVWKDPRRTGNLSIRQVPFNEMEGNFCALNRSVLEDIGGFDEDMDFKFYGMDWYGVLERLHISGQKFYIDESIESYSLEHGRVADWEDKNGIHGGYTKLAVEYSKNPKLKFL